MKGFFRSVPNIVMLTLILLLSAALVISSVSLVQSQQDVDAAVNAASDAVAAANAEQEQAREELEAEIEALNGQVEEKAKELDAAKKDLDAEKQTKEELEQTIQDLKDQIESLRAQVERLKLSAANTGPKICYLTFDDGPSENTLKILDILKKANAKATFFVLGTGNLDYLDEIHAGGHAIGLHGDNHVYKSIYASEEAFFANIESLRSKVKARTGVDTQLLRFPGGSSNAVSKSICPGIMTKLVKSVQEKGYTYFDWNVSAEDATGKPITAQQMVKIVTDMAKDKNQICILMHDSSSKTTTVEALPAMIAALRDMGYRFEALSADAYSFAHGRLNN